jgi:DNA-binding transcriptional regulator YiaG
MPKSLKKVRPGVLRAARDVSTLTQTRAASLVYTSVHNWRNWEQGRHPIPRAIFELFLLKTGQLTLASPSERRLLA